MPPTHTVEGLDAARVIREELPKTSLLVLSAHVELEHAMELLAGGRGIGYLLKSRVIDVDDFIDTLERVGERRFVVDPRWCRSWWRRVVVTIRSGAERARGRGPGADGGKAAPTRASPVSCDHRGNRREARAQRSRQAQPARTDNDHRRVHAQPAQSAKPNVGELDGQESHPAESCNAVDGARRTAGWTRSPVEERSEIRAWRGLMNVTMRTPEPISTWSRAGWWAGLRAQVSDLVSMSYCPGSTTVAAQTYNVIERSSSPTTARAVRRRAPRREQRVRHLCAASLDRSAWCLAVRRGRRRPGDRRRTARATARPAPLGAGGLRPHRRPARGRLVHTDGDLLCVRRTSADNAWTSDRWACASLSAAGHVLQVTWRH